MKKILINASPDNIMYWKFDSMMDFAKYTTTCKTLRSELASEETGGGGFHDFSNWGEYVEKVFKGIDIDDNESFSFYGNDIKRKYKSSRDFFGNVQVPKAIMGLPKACSRPQKLYSNHQIELSLLSGCNCGKTAEDIIEFNIKILEFVNDLIRRGDSVRISQLYTNDISRVKDDRYTHFYTGIVVKDFNQVVSMKQLNVFLGTADIYRRGIFRCIEADEVAHRAWGYGKTPELEEATRIYETISKEMNIKKDNAILLPAIGQVPLEELEGTLNSLREKYEV